MPRIVIKTALVLGALAFGLAASSSLLAQDKSTTSAPTVEKKQPHRLYDDRGTLDWRVKWADAARIAKERRKLVFVEFGRES